MSKLIFGISKPAKGETVPERFAVSGVVQVDTSLPAGGIWPLIKVDSIRVRFGDGGEVKTATVSGTSWAATGSVADSAVGGSTFTVTAVASGTKTPKAGLSKDPDDPGGPGPDPGLPQPFTASVSVVVRLEDHVLDTVTIDEFTTPVPAPPDGRPYRLNLTGTADDVSGIKSVEIKLDKGEFEPPDTHSVTGTTWKWAKALDLDAGQHSLVAQATDASPKGNSRSTPTMYIDVRLRFEPGPVEQAFEPTRYLFELGCGSTKWDGFAKRYVQVGDGSKPLTPAKLAQRFHQPYDRITEAGVLEQATRPLPQARIAIEVLREHLASPPPELDQRFRGLAYQMLLVNLGTSYDELRLARAGDPEARQALADRLGLGRLTVRPDHLDDLLLSPAALADEKLETLFGYQSTAPADPLGPLPEDAAVLLWQRGALAAQWQRDDESERDGPDAAVPIVDPDILGEGHLRRTNADDPARSLWTARRSWIAGRLAVIQRDANKVSDPLTRFDRLVSKHISKELDVAALAARDAEGEDIEPELLPLELGLAAFRFLAHSRAALTGGQLLETEWQDIFSILIQVAKRRKFRAWRHEERKLSLVLAPSSFRLDQTEPLGPSRADETSPWRFSRAVYSAWLRTLQARIEQGEALEARYRWALQTVEAQLLPALRDALIAESGQSAPELTRELMIDLEESSGRQTTRVEQAIETLQAALFSMRAGMLPADAAGRTWTIKGDSSGERNFDAEWAWMGSYASWLAATRVFAYPESQLLPVLYIKQPPLDPPTKAFQDLIANLRKQSRVTAEDARELAKGYLHALRAEVTLNDNLKEPWALTDERADGELIQLQKWSEQFELRQQRYRELFWLVPMALAQKLRESRQFQAALDWYRTVYAYHLPPVPPANRRTYRGLQLEDDLSSDYGRVPEWLLKELNPHIFAQTRHNCYTRATIMTIADCFLAYGDAEFAANTIEANARARTLYETALDLLDLPEAQPESDPFPTNPVWDSLHQQAQSSLNKIHRGLNIAGAVNLSLQDGETTLPSHYRYTALVGRAKNLVAIAQQLEAAFLSALEQRDARTYDAMQAGRDLQVARVSLTIQDIKVADAQAGVRLAGLQRERAHLQEDYYTRQIQEGLNGYEQNAIDELKSAAFREDAASVLALGSAVASLSNPVGVFGGLAQAASSLAAAASTRAQIAQTLASFERREQEWKLQRSLAHDDVEIGAAQVQLAQDQVLLAKQEGRIAQFQFEHARAVADFLATKFTNAELFEWMSGVLGRVYAYFLQQATASAQLAEAQLAFERQEPIARFIESDYWRDTADATTTSASATPDRQGMTGSERLLRDIYRLDEYAFETDRRKLHLTQTLSLAELAAAELERFRGTGVLTFATPEQFFDHDFPGHYLRLTRKVRVSLIALIPPTRGIRATLSASGVSRTVVARGPFETMTMRREPESIAFTSAIGATGLFELEPESDILLPFEGMGVDTTWQLELPKAANPFDYRSIADVLLTIEYTALDSAEHRQAVIRSLDGRFSADRSFSIRNQFPDVWYELNNSQTLDDPQRRMLAVLPLTADDFPPHIPDLTVAQLTLFVVRDDSLLQELTVPALRHVTAGAPSVEAGEVKTVEGVVGTRRPGGAPWQVFIGSDPVGSWELQLEHSAETRGWFADGLIQDLALVFTLTGSSPPW